MANGPEPKDENGEVPLVYSMDDQLKAFNSYVDKATNRTSRVIPGLLTAPGFLFRDGKSRSKRFESDELYIN